MKPSGTLRHNQPPSPPKPSDNRLLKITNVLKTQWEGILYKEGHPAECRDDGGHCYQNEQRKTTYPFGASKLNQRQESKQSSKFTNETKTESQTSTNPDSHHLIGYRHHQSEVQKVRPLMADNKIKQRSKSHSFDLTDKTTGKNESHGESKLLEACSLKKESKADTQSIKSTAKITAEKRGWNSDSQAIEGHKSATEKRNQGSIIINIPPAIAVPAMRKISSTSDSMKIVFDLETTSLGEDAEICQIAATDGMDNFDIYVRPQGSISREASAVNKLTKKRGVLLHEGRRVTAVRQNVALAQFLNWLKFKTPCVLIAHNCRAFDAKHLVKAMTSCNEIKEFRQKVLGFSDTLTAFRERFPARRSYTQTSLAKDLLSATYNAHNARDDVKMLQKLVTKFISDDLLFKHSFTVSWYCEYSRYVQQKNENFKTLEPLVRSGRISAGIADKAARSGLTFGHMQFAFQNGGTDGLRNVLTEVSHGKSRVTNSEKILAEICNFFKK